MDPETVRRDVTDILREVFTLSEDPAEAEAALADVSGELALNSLQLIELVVALEDRFHGELDMEVLEDADFASVAAVCRLVERSFVAQA